MRYPYALIDLHCDTLTDCSRTGCPDTLDDPRRALSLSNLPRRVRWAQFFAAFIPDDLRGRAAADYFDCCCRSFYRQMEKFCRRVSPCRTAEDMERAWARGKTAAFLTVENGSALAGDLSRVEILSRAGVVCLTLTWNGENELGSGHDTQRGLTPFGRSAVGELERRGILVDVSHLNDRGLEELLAVAKKPFAATHSNARSVCAHRRNLPDEMIRELARRDCLMGLNYYDCFLRDGGGASEDDLWRHVERFLELGAGKHLALGSDFDGAEVPAFLDSPARAAGLYGFLLSRGLSRAQAEDILFRNAWTFFRKNLRRDNAS